MTTDELIATTTRLLRAGHYEECAQLLETFLKGSVSLEERLLGVATLAQCWKALGATVRARECSARQLELAGDKAFWRLDAIRALVDLDGWTPVHAQAVQDLANDANAMAHVRHDATQLLAERALDVGSADEFSRYLLESLDMEWDASMAQGPELNLVRRALKSGAHTSACAVYLDRAMEWTRKHGPDHLVPMIAELRSSL